MCGGDDFAGEVCGLIVADCLELAGLQEAEEFDLIGLADFADFVEKHRAVVARRGEDARAVGGGAGE